MEILQEVCILAGGIYLIPCAVSDIGKKGISVRYLVSGLLLSAAAAVVWTALGNQSAGDLMLSLLPGLFLLAAAVLTEGKIGVGDGLVFLVIGLLVGCGSAFLIMMCALLLSAVWGSFLLLGKKAGRSTAIPWLPFVLAGYWLWAAFHWVGG